MASSETSVRALQLSFEFKRSDLQNVKRNVAQAVKEIKTVGDTNRDIARSADKAGATMKSEFKAAASEAKKLAAAQEKVTASIERGEAAARQYEERYKRISDQVSAGGDVVSNVGAIRGLSGAVGFTGAERGIGAAAEVADLVEQLPRLKESIAALPDAIRAAASAIGGPGLGMIGVTIAAVGAFALLSAELSKAGQAASDLLNKQREAIEIVRGASAETIAAEVEAARLRRDNARAEVERLSTLLNNFRQELRKQDLLSVAEGLRVFNNELQGVYNNLSDAEKEFAEAEAALSILEGAANDTATVTRLASEAEAVLAAERQKALDASILSAIQFRTTLENQSADALRNSLDAKRNEIALIQEAIKENRLSEEATTQLLDRQRQLIAEIRIIERGYLDAAEAAEQAAESEAKLKERREKQIAAAKEQAKAFSEAAQKLREAATKAREAESQLTDQLKEIEDKRKTANLKAVEERGKAITEAEAEASEARTEAIRTAQIERQKLEESHQKALQKIVREGARSQELAIQDRDAVALEAAQEAQKTALDEENDAYKEQRKVIDDNLRETNRQIGRRLDEQRRVAIQKYNEQLRDAAAAASAEVGIARQKYQQQLTDLANTLSQDTRIRSQANQLLLQGTSGFVSGLLNLARQLQTASTRATTSTSSVRRVSISTGSIGGRGGFLTGPAISAFADGGITPANQDFLVGEKGPELLRLPTQGRVFNQRQLRRGDAGSSAVNINVSGATTRTVDARSRQQALRAFDEILTEMGVS